MSKKAAYHHGDLRSALIEAATRIIEVDGLDKLSLRAVAREAQVSQAAPYHHFKSKEDLMDAVGASGFARLYAMQEDAMEGLTSAMARLRANGVAYVQFAVQYPAFFRLMFSNAYIGDEPKEEFRAAGALAFESMAKAVGQVIEDQKLDADVNVLALQSWAMVHGLAHILIDCRSSPLSHLILELGEDKRLTPAHIKQLTEKVLTAFLKEGAQD